MIILGIETSCDETALSLLEVTEEAGGKKLDKPLFKVLANTLISQISIHEQYGGVFPMVAKREHAKNLCPLLYKILSETDETKTTQPVALTSPQKEEIKTILEKEDGLFDLFLQVIVPIPKPAIDIIAVTAGPGLEPALWVGLSFAKALSKFWNIPVVAANHMEGHILGSLLKPESWKSATPLAELSFPSLALLVSGGHTELVHMKDWQQYVVVGKTRDDAVGEAFDKVARILGLLYPGGPEISRLAAEFRKNSPKISKPEKSLYHLPRPMIHSHDLDFSFSGLKTAVLYMAKKIPEITPEIRSEIAKEFEDAVVDTLISKTETAIEEFGVQSIIMGGGVIANAQIREQFAQLAAQRSLSLHLPTPELSTDNALMIALAGYFNLKDSKTSDIEVQAMRAQGNMVF